MLRIRATFIEYFSASKGEESIANIFFLTKLILFFSHVHFCPSKKSAVSPNKNRSLKRNVPKMSLYLNRFQILRASRCAQLGDILKYELDIQRGGENVPCLICSPASSYHTLQIVSGTGRNQLHLLTGKQRAFECKRKSARQIFGEEMGLLTLASFKRSEESRQNISKFDFCREAMPRLAILP